MSLRIRAVIFLIAAVALVLYYQRRPHTMPAVAEEPPPPQQAVADEEPTWTPDLRPAQPAEVLAAVERAFPGVFPAETQVAHRAVVGDFNGDRSPDLAVPVRALAEKVAEINGELVNWILQDPGAPLPGPGPGAPPRAAVDKGEMLLAVVHGIGGAGWRDPNARQAYLLKAAFEGQLDVQSRDTLFPKQAKEKKGTPQLRGDLIYKAGSGTFLFWTGGRYSWHKPKAPGAAVAAGQGQPGAQNLSGRASSK